MTSQQQQVAARILALPANRSDEDFQRKITLGREFLRRLKLWEQAVGLWPGYPFGDLAQHIAPHVRADADTLARVLAHLTARNASVTEITACTSALHLAAAEDAGALEGFNLPRLFMPLLGIYALGGSGRFHKGYFEIDLGAIRLNERDWSSAAPLAVEGDAEERTM